MKYIIYRISIADYTYIGSTRDFNQRKKKHKTACNNVNNPCHNFKVYQIIRENGGWNCCGMIPIEEYECENNTQARIREEYWRREYDAKMNTIKAYIDENEKKQYSQSKNKNWYGKNKEYQKEKLKEKITCECGSIICKGDISKHLKTTKHLAFVASNTNQEYIADDNACDL